MATVNFGILGIGISRTADLLSIVKVPKEGLDRMSLGDLAIGRGGAARG